MLVRRLYGCWVELKHLSNANSSIARVMTGGAHGYRKRNKTSRS